MGHDSAEGEVGHGPQEGAGGGGVPIGSAKGRGRGKDASSTKVPNGRQYLLEVNG